MIRENIMRQRRSQRYSDALKHITRRADVRLFKRRRPLDQLYSIITASYNTVQKKWLKKFRLNFRSGLALYNQGPLFKKHPVYHIDKEEKAVKKHTCHKMAFTKDQENVQEIHANEFNAGFSACERKYYPIYDICNYASNCIE